MIVICNTCSTRVQREGGDVYEFSRNKSSNRSVFGLSLRCAETTGRNSLKIKEM